MRDIMESLFHTIEQLANEEREVIEDAREFFISEKSLVNIGTEMTIPKHLQNQARYQYRNGEIEYDRLKDESEVLFIYLKLKKELTKPNPTPFHVRYKYSRLDEMAPLQFYDFYLVHQAWEITRYTVEWQDYYNYDNEGMTKLAAKVAIYLLENSYMHEGHKINSLTPDLSTNPSPVYAYKEGTNVKGFIEEQMDEMEEFYEYQDDDDDEDVEF